MNNTAYIALGSNIGDRAAYIHAALDGMNSYLAVEETSHLYETDPMLVTDQPLFLNAVCKVTTGLTPPDLLRALKLTEDQLERVKTIRYGPRTIDLDILFYNDAIVDTPDLTIPHIRIPERDFVLAPMLDLAPELLHPRLGLGVRELWQRLDKPVPPRVMPLADGLWRWGQGARVMGILNLTPDSFSGDGLAGAPDPLAAALTLARKCAAEGADVLDIGAYSTRPGHTDLPVEQEINRVIPVIGALRDQVDLPLSIDTFRVDVAKAALDAGASWLNDVSGLRTAADEGEENPRLSGGMAALAACRRVPLVLMNNRAPLHSGEVNQDTRSSPPSDDIVADVGRELAAALELARGAGVARWHRIVDPGIGFGKTVSQHAALIARLDQLTRLGYPLLFGCSRKGFLGKMSGGAPVEERLAATIAANVLAVERGAQIVRVHDVRENVQALRVANAILKRDSDSM